MRTSSYLGHLTTLSALLTLAVAGPWAANPADAYQLGPDSFPHAGVPQGRVERFTFTASRVFPDTRRECWVYIPSQYAPAHPAALMVFQDGQAYVSTNGSMRVPIVFDNLIQRGEMPVTVGLFVNPGARVIPGGDPARGASNRSFEYDSLGDAYARFLVEELIPYVEQTYHLTLSHDPWQRAIGGISSGGICAWTVAWERPDQFRKVLSHVGSFTNIRGGNVYPALIRKTERKPIRIFLQDGRNDLNNLHGNWPLAAQEMASALAFAGYDFRFVLGDGAHNGRQGGAILPDSLRWLWRDKTPLPAPLTNDNLAGDEALSKVLPQGGQTGDWEVVGEGYAFTDAATTDAAGNFYFSDLPNATLHRIGLDGRDTRWFEAGPKISGLKLGPDGQFYAATQGGSSGGKPSLVTIDPQTKTVAVVATEVAPNDLIVSRAGWIYFTDTAAGQVLRVPISARGMARPPVVAGGIHQPNGISLSADQQRLIVSEYGGTNVWSFLIAADGTLRGGEANMTLRTPPGRRESGGDGLTTDLADRYYVTSYAGTQVFDSTGRLGGVISKPSAEACVSVAFAGPDHAYLYACAGHKVWRRKTLTRGALFFQP